MLIASLLHDMLEDSFLLTPGRIRLSFGDRVAVIVDVITKPKKNDPRFVTDKERHFWYFNQIAESDVCCKIVKLADRLHNMRTLGGCSAEKQRRKMEETRTVYLPLIDAVSSAYPIQGNISAEQFKIALAVLESLRA